MKNCVIYILIMLFAGCKNDNFSPLGDLEHGFSTYCILDSRQELQFVELQKLYFPAKNMEKKLEGMTTITLYESENSYYFHDTVINNYENFNVFYIKNFILKRGISYNLKVENSNYPAREANVYIPPVQEAVFIIDSTYFPEPYKHYEYNFKVVFISGGSKNSDFHFIIEYENEEKKSNFIEIPYGLFSNYDINLFDQEVVKEYYSVISGLYPRLHERPGVYTEFEYFNSVTDSRIKLGSYEVCNYENSSLIYAFEKMTKGKSAKNLIIKRAFLKIYSIDDELYKYYLSMHGFNEEYSIRLDKPFWTNFSTVDNSGMGVLGSVVVDTVKVEIPLKILEDYDVKNGMGSD